jgi:hypothetical protein
MREAVQKHARSTGETEGSYNRSYRGGDNTMSTNVTLMNPPSDPALRQALEAKMQLAFDKIRPAGAGSAAGAADFARGSDVVVPSGAYAPGSAAGKRLLAHELTHVSQ